MVDVEVAALELLDRVGDLQGAQALSETAHAELQVELVLSTTLQVEQAQTAQGLGVCLAGLDGVEGEPAFPDRVDPLTGVESDRQIEA